MNIHRIVVSPFETNCYLIGCETTGKAAVIDPGDSVETIIESAESNGLIIEKILNTHAHIDHTAGVHEMKTHLGIPFYLHKDDEFLLARIMEQGSMFGMHVEHKPEVDVYLHDGDALNIGKETVTILHTPGHSPGGCCLLTENGLFAGDTLFAGSIGRHDLPGGSYETLIHSIRTKLLVLDDGLNVYCGHGPATTIGIEKRSNRFLV
ncbi:MBL fold metallo-hydrolase [candidate division KSB1 bacterium]